MKIRDTIFLFGVFLAMTALAHGNEPFEKLDLNPNADYCTPSFGTGCTSGDVIDSFVLDGENNTSIEDLDTGCSDQGYDNRISFTETVDLSPDGSYMAMITTHNTSDNVAIWIDFNDDGTFEESERVALAAELNPDTGSIVMLNIPGNAEVGEHRMRVMLAWFSSPDQLDPCNSFPFLYFGEIHDYMINIIEPPLCLRPVDVAVDNITESEADVSWSPNSAETNWTVAYGLNGFNPDNEGEIIAVSDTPQAHLNDLLENETYDIYVKALCEPGIDESPWSLSVSFTTTLMGGYCVPLIPNGCSNGDLIDSLTLDGENGTTIEDLNTGCSEETYDNRIPFTDVVDLLPGGDYNVMLTTQNTHDNVVIWIDFDDDGVFDESDRVATKDGLPSGSAGVVPLNIPITANQGEHRMRVMLGWITPAASLDPCNDNEVAGYGETHDYWVNILEAPDCFRIHDLNISEITDSSAMARWSPGNDEVEWEVEYGVSGFVIGNGTTINVTDNPETFIDNLSADTVYDVYVTSICENGNTDAVGPVSFTTYPEGVCGTQTPSNGFEAGIGFLGIRPWANDFKVSANTTFNLSHFEFNAMINPGTTITGVEIHFYNDSGDGPGSMIGIGHTYAPTDVSTIGVSAFGNDVVKVQVDFGDPISFEADSDEEVVYWISVRIDYSEEESYWEITSLVDTPNPIYSLSADGSYWIRDEGFDGVMSLFGSCGVLGIADQDYEDFTYYPNPVENVLNVKAVNTIENIIVYNLLGQSIIKQSPNSLETQIDMDGLQPGVYLVKVDVNGNSKTFRLIKQ